MWAVFVWCYTKTMKPKVIFIHGNGGGTGQDNWFPWCASEFKKHGFEAIAPDFPDPKLARAKYWLPYIQDVLKADEKTVLIGHSSGAVASMRCAETHKILGSVLVGANYTDLGYESEKQSGYFDTPWDWQAIKNNQKWVIQFASTDDPYIPINESRYIHDKLGSKYFEFNNQGHFGEDIGKTEFPELVSITISKLGIM